MRSLSLAFFLLLVTVGPAPAWYPRFAAEAILDNTIPVPVVGSLQTAFTGSDDTLIQFARANGLGYEALTAANPDIDPWLPGAGQPLQLPFATILPGPPQDGITVNLADLRLYLIWKEGGALRVRIYPIGIGDEGWETPEGAFSVRSKLERPYWKPPESIRRQRPELPALVAPGPQNPLGDYWIGFSGAGHGIHGTRQPYGVGRRVSHGCLRLYPEDIRNLYQEVRIGTPVRIVYRPIKVGMRDGLLYLEVHSDYRHRIDDPLKEVERQARHLGWQQALDWEVIERTLNEARGVPMPISAPSVAEGGIAGQ